MFQENPQHPALLCEQDFKQGCVRTNRPPRNFQHFALSRIISLEKLQLYPSLTSGGSACFLVALFGRGLLNSRSAGRPKNSRKPKVYSINLGVLILTRSCFPTWHSGKFWRDPSVSHSASRAFMCHAPVSLMRSLTKRSWTHTIPALRYRRKHCYEERHPQNQT